MEIVDNKKGYISSSHVIPFKDEDEKDYEVQFSKNKFFKFKLTVINN